jgi:hypothetical protein
MSKLRRRFAGESGNPRHDEEELIWYNLACYACVLGKKFEARKKLEKAIDMGGDADFEALWRSGEKK